MTSKVTLALFAFFLAAASLSLGSKTSLAGAAPKATPALLEKGKTAYTTNCATCHGDKGDGNGVAGAYMTPKPRNFVADKFKKGDTAAAVFKTVSEGLPGTAMVAFGHLSEDDRWAITHYLLSFRKAKK